MKSQRRSLIRFSYLIYERTGRKIVGRKACVLEQGYERDVLKISERGFRKKRRKGGWIGFIGEWCIFSHSIWRFFKEGTELYSVRTMGKGHHWRLRRCILSHRTTQRLKNVKIRSSAGLGKKRCVFIKPKKATPSRKYIIELQSTRIWSWWWITSPVPDKITNPATLRDTPAYNPWEWDGLDRRKSVGRCHERARLSGFGK